MTKSASQTQTRRRRRGAHVGSRLTEPEFDAALQLIQLSGDSSSAENTNKFGSTFPRRDDDDVDIDQEEEEESVANTTGSTADEISSTTLRNNNNNNNNNNNIVDENLDDEACPPRQRKFRSIRDIYIHTRPLIKKPADAYFWSYEGGDWNVGLWEMEVRLIEIFQEDSRVFLNEDGIIGWLIISKNSDL
ncbi:hypothetical protein ACH5RR_022491 [Cinchona calisaya]|uniref:Uncharacterized protein n=1 Tax=Cinchona calisaya TaxID=153742 RepID=A0ABD2Z9K8_9GENT